MLVERIQKALALVILNSRFVKIDTLRKQNPVTIQYFHCIRTYFDVRSGLPPFASAGISFYSLNHVLSI